MLSNSASASFFHTLWPRRRFLQLAGLALSARGWAFAGPAEPSQNILPASPEKNSLNEGFPTQPPALAREMVTVSHFDLKRVKELVEARSSLARAAWDWGFGDWETALGAASHMGNRAIAEYLISRGARPSLFSAAMFGHLEVVKAFVSAQAGVQRIRGPHSISLLAHAKAGGETALPVYNFLLSLGDAGADTQQPISQSELDSILGTYSFGPAENDQIQVAVDKGTVAWTRKGTMGRPLFHLGRRVFYPWGAEAVRVEFKDDSGETLMTIHDPEPVLSVKRKK
jgi:hypothetical protein